MKKSRRKMLLSFFQPKEHKKLSAKDTLNWLEEANKFFYALDPKKYERDQIKMRKMGW
jgi:hypothetical protein